MATMDEFKKIAPELSKLKKEQVFGTPKNYFDDFPARMHAKIEQEKNPAKEKKRPIVQLLKPALGLAASFALIAMLVYVPIKLFVEQNPPEVAEFMDYTDSDLKDLMANMDENTFFAMLEEEEEVENSAFTEEDLQAYVNANFTAYEIFEFTEK